jgi:hypothetical protein
MQLLNEKRRLAGAFSDGFIMWFYHVLLQAAL